MSTVEVARKPVSSGHIFQIAILLALHEQTSTAIITGQKRWHTLGGAFSLE